MAIDSISRLIFNTLAQHENLNLPGIGSLRVVSEPARVRGNKTLAPPYTEVVYAPEENPDFSDIIKLIREKSKKTEQVSIENYQKWASKVYEEDAVRIPSVGMVREGYFTPTTELERALNPTGTEPVKLQRQMGGGQLFLWIVIALLVGAGIAAGVISLLNSRPGKYEAPYAAVTPDPATLPETSEAAPQTDAATADGANAGGATASAGTSAATPSTSAAPAGTSATTAQPAAQSAQAATPSATTPQSGGVRYYVVIGVYSTDANAERFIASSRRRDNTQNYRKQTLANGKIMVYLGDAPSEAEANRIRRSVTHNFPDAWVRKGTR